MPSHGAGGEPATMTEAIALAQDEADRRFEDISLPLGCPTSNEAGVNLDLLCKACLPLDARNQHVAAAIWWAEDS
jgi:hypothetical protein